MHSISEAQVMATQKPPSPLIGWPLLPLPDTAGRLNYPTLEESVRQQIQVILRTRPGEQLMKPAFGAGLEEFLHESNTLTTRRRIKDLIAESIERWEKRIILDRVEVREVPERPTHIRIEMSYRLRRTGAPQQVGLMMELEA
jgi:phage baseplate assembly protein W